MSGPDIIPESNIHNVYKMRSCREWKHREIWNPLRPSANGKAGTSAVRYRKFKEGEEIRGRQHRSKNVGGLWLYIELVSSHNSCIPEPAVKVLAACTKQSERTLYVLLSASHTVCQKLLRLAQPSNASHFTFSLWYFDVLCNTTSFRVH